MKLVKVKWHDAVNYTNEDWKDTTKHLLAQKETTGWLVHQDKEKIILAHERDPKTLEPEDWTIIPRQLILKPEALKSNSNKKKLNRKGGETEHE